MKPEPTVTLVLAVCVTVPIDVETQTVVDEIQSNLESCDWTVDHITTLAAWERIYE